MRSPVPPTTPTRCGLPARWLQREPRLGGWPVESPDLASRLATLPIARVDPPDDVLLSSLMVKLFADRQLKVAPDVIKYLSVRIERSFATAEATVDALDRLSLARQKPVTRQMATELLGSDSPGED